MILAVVLTVSFATPAFAGSPEPKPLPEQGWLGVVWAQGRINHYIGESIYVLDILLRLGTPVKYEIGKWK